MNPKYLEEKIAERKKQALDKNIQEKVEIVTWTLGKVTPIKLKNYWGASTATYSSGRLSMKGLHKEDMDPYEKSIEVSVECEGKLVYEGTSSTYSCNQRQCSPSAFVPGYWESDLDEAYVEALKVISQKKEEQEKDYNLQKKQEETDKKLRWGL